MAIKADHLAETASKYILATNEEMEQAHLTIPMRARMIRLREMYALWLQNPRWCDRDIVSQLRSRYQLGLSQAYEDCRLVKVCLGNLGRLTRDYDRYLFRQRCEEGWQMAREKEDPKAFAAVTATYLKGTGLDRDEPAAPDYASIAPQQFVITSDPSVAGFKVIPGILERARRLEERYIEEVDEVEETEKLKS